MAFEESLQPAKPAEVSPPPMPGEGRVPWGLRDLAKAIGLVVVGSILLLIPTGIAIAIIDQPNSDAEALASLVPSLALEALMLAIALRFTIGKYRCSWRDLGFRLPARAGWWLPLALVIGAWIIIVAYFAILSALDVGGLEDQEQLPDEAFESPALIPVVAVIALIAAPVAEETFFRGFLFGGLRRRWGLLGAVLASGLLFGLAHYLPILYIPFTLISVLFALGYVYSGSLWVPMAAHFLFNGISFAIGVATAGD